MTYPIGKRRAARGLMSPMIRGLLASSALVSASMVHAQSALPQAGQVIAGSATIASSGSATVITQSSARAIIDWNSFSVGEVNSVNFVQPDSRSAILNRVSGTTASTLAGAISGNGQVYLINANGIAITPSGQVNVAGGFVASTLAIADEDFMSGSLRFTGNGASAPVSNHGTITIGSGGFAALLGGSVSNYGTISVPLGRIGLGAGEAATLDLSGDGLLQLALPSQGDGKDPLITAAGSMAGARIELHAAALSGAARDAVYVPGELSARGAYLEGGVIILDSGAGTMLVSGKLDAASDMGLGGRVALGGTAIDLRGASIDVRGTRGGSVSVGGGARGAAVAGLTTASSVSIDSASQIKASGEAGGDVTIWSNDNTRFSGAIIATGNDGDGGSAEVSSHGGFGFAGRADLRSTHGAAGILLLDPYNVSISSAADVGQSGFAANASGATINVTSLQNALATANVTVSTGASGSEAGNITVANALSWSANTRLTLDAAGGVIVNAAITNSGATSGLTLTAAGVGGVSGAGNIATTGALSVNVNHASGTGTLSGVISGSGGLTKAGSGALTLSGTNTNSGATNVNAGTLQILNTSTSAAIGVLGSGAVSIASGATLQITNSRTGNDQYWVNTLSGAGTLSLNGPDGSITTLGNNSSFTGATLISSGVINLANSNAFGTGAVTITGGAIRATGSARSLANNFVLSGTIGVGFATNITGTVTLAGDTTLTASANAGSTWTNLVLGSYTLATGDVGPNRLGATWTGAGLQFNGAISGTGGITQGSLGWLTLVGANTYTGATMVNAGALGAASTSAFGNNSAVTVASGATLDLQGRSNSVGSLSGAGSIINSNAAPAVLTTGGLNSSTSFSGVIQNSVGSLGLTKIGSGTQTLSGANNYTGATTVSGGTLLIGGAGVLGSGSYAGALSVASGANFNFASSANQSFTNLAAGTGTVTLAGTGNATITGTQPFTGTLNVNQTATISGGSNSAISGVGNAAAVNIGGYVTLGGTNSFIGHSSTTPITINAGGTLYNPGTATFHLPTGLTLNGGTLASAASLNAEALGTGTFNLDGPVVVTANSTISATNVMLSQAGGTIFNVSPGAALTVSGSLGHATLGGVGDYGLNLTGSGTMTLSGANSYTGATTVTAGTLKAGSTSAFGSNSAVTVASGATLDLTGYANAIGSLAGAGIVTNSSATAAILTTGGLNTSTSFSGILRNGTGALGLTKTGIGTQTLSGANTYSGATVVNAGALNFTASQLNTAGLTIASGATLSLANGAAVSNPVAGRTVIAGSVSGYGTLYGYSGAGDGTPGTQLLGNAALTASGGTLTISGTGYGPSTRGIELASGANITTNGNVILAANGTGSPNTQRAFLLAGAVAINSVSGLLTVNIASASGDVRFGPASNMLTLSGTQAWNVTSGGFFDVWTGTMGAFNLTASANANLTFNAGANGIVSNMAGWNWNLGAGSNVSINQVSLGGNFNLAGSGTLAIALPLTAASTITVASASDNPIISGVVSGGFGLTKAGAGTLTQSGANSYTGTTNVNAGTLKAGSTSAFGSASAVTVASGATLDLGGYSNSIGSLAGAGIVTNSSAIAAILSTGALNTSTSFSGVLQNGAGALGLTKIGSGTQTLSGTNSYGGVTTISSGTLQIGAGGTTGTLGTGAVANNAALLFNRSDTLTVNNAISGSGSVALAATGNIFMAGVNSYSGGTTVSGNALIFAQNPSALGSGTVTINANSALGLWWNTGNATFANNIIINSAGVTGNTSGSNGKSAIYSDGGGAGYANYTLSGTVTLGHATSSIGGYPSNSLAITGQLTGSGGLALNQSASGAGAIVTLSNATNNYTGATLIAANSNLKLGVANALPNTTALTVASGGAFNLNGLASTIGSLAGAGSITLGGGALTTGASNASTLFSGVISGSGSFTKIGSGAQTLSGTNSYGGATNVNAGTLAAGSTSGLSSNAALTVASGATLDLGGYSNSIGSLAGAGIVTNSSAIAAILTTGGLNSSTSFSGTLQNGSSTLGLTKIGTGTQSLSGTNIRYSGATQINAGTLKLTETTLFESAATVAAGATLSLARSVDGVANRARVSKTIAGAGTVSIDNDTSGINGGWISFNNADVGLTSGFTGNVSINSGVLTMDSYAGLWEATPALSIASGGLLALRGQSLAVSSLSGSGDIINSWNGNAAQTLTITNPSASSFSGIIHGSVASGGSDGSIEQGVINLVKAGAGTLTLSGTNSYIGTTSVNAGSLVAGSSSAFGNNSAVTVASGATLDLAGFSNSIGSLAGAGIVTNSNATAARLTAGGNNSSTSFSGLIQNGVGTTRFTKSGSGTLTFSGANSYSGGSIVSAGTLVFNHASASASGYGTPVASLTVESGATLRFAAGSSPAIRANLIVNGGTVSADLASNNHLDWGAGSITLNGGTLTSVNGVGGAANDGGLGNWHFNGTLVTVTQDALISSSSWSAGNFTADLNIASGATLRIDATGVGLGTFSKSGLGTLLLTGTNTGAGGRTNTINAGTVQIGTGGAGASLDNLNLVNNGALISNTSSSSIFYGVISGSGTLTKAGSGTLTLAGANSYTGATNIAAGTLAISSSGSLGGGNYAGAISLSGGNLTIGSSAAQTLSGGVTLGANGMISATGTGKLTVSGAVALGANTLSLGASQTNSVSAARLLDVSGVISGTGGITASSGFPMLSGNNLFTGGVTVSSGLVIAHSNALGSGAKTVNLGNRQLVLTGGITVPASIAFTTSGNAASGITTGLIYNDQGDNAINGLVALSTGFGGTSFYANAGSLSFNGLVRTNGTGRDLTIEGPGNFFFNGSLQNYGAGALSLAIGLLGGNVGTTTLSGANLFNGGITLNAGTLRVAGAGSLGTYPGTAASYGGAISIASGASFDYASSSDQTLGGVISGSGTLIKSSSATSQLLLAGANSFSDSMAVNAGTLKAGATSGFGNNAVVSVASGAVVDLGGFSNAIGSLTGLGSVTNNGAAAVLSLGGNNGAAQFDGSLQDGSGVLGLTKLGSGMLTLAGSKNYTGATMISGGTLKIIGNGALGGGNYGGALTLSGGNFLYDGSNAQTLSGPVTLTSNASVSNASNQLVTITGNVALGANALTLLGNGSAADADLGAGNQNIAISGVISGTGATALVIGSASTGANVLLSGQNLFSGTLSFPATNAQPASKLTLASSGALGLGSKVISLTGGGELHLTNSISLASGISFALSGNASQNGRASTRGVIYSDQGSNVIAGALTLQGGNGHSRLISEAGAQLSLNGDIATASGLSRQLILAGEGTTIVNGVIANGAGTTSLVVDSVSGSARLNGTNSYTGPSYLLGGTLVAGNADAFGSGGGLYMTGGTLQYASGISTDLSARLLNSGGQSWRIDTNGQDVTFASGLSGASSLTKMGGGTLILASANSFSGPITINGGALDLSGSLNLGTANAAIFVGTGTTLTGTGVLTAAALELSGMGNTSLTGSNAVGEISTAGPIGTLSFNAAQSLDVGAIGAIGAVRLSASGAGSDLTLRSGGIASLASGDAVVLSAERGFINQIGSGAVSAVNGRWLIYSSAPTASVFNGLDSANRAVWNARLATIAPGSVDAGNHYLFAYQPMVRISSINDVKTYGEDATSAVASDYTISGIESGQNGAYLADSAAIAFTGTPLISSAGADARAGVAGGPYAINVAQGSLVAQNGYALAFDSSGVLIIDRATLRVSANGAIKTYDGLVWNGGNGVSYTGFVNGEDAASLGGSLSFGGSAQGAVDAGSYDLSASGWNSSNYDISYAPGTLTIDRATLLVSANDAIKTYDGLAWSGGNGVRYAGFVNGEGASVLGGSLSFGGSAQGAVAAGSYGLSASGLSSNNYDISYAPGTLTIDRATLLVSANDAIKTYDGLSWSGGNGVRYSGLVNGEGASVLGGAISFGGSAQGAAAAGSYGLSASGLSSNNYDISYAPGTLTIDRATLLVSANDAIKTYDGLAWSGGNGVRYSGFVNEEGASVLGGAISFGGSAQGAVEAGAYGLSVSGLSSGNYAISYAPGALRIDRATLLVSANDAIKTYDGLAWSGGNGVRYAGFVNGEVATVLGGSLIFGGSAQGAVEAGVYDLSVAGLTSPNYAISYQPATVRIGSLALSHWPSIYTNPAQATNAPDPRVAILAACASGTSTASPSGGTACGAGR